MPGSFRLRLSEQMIEVHPEMQLPPAQFRQPRLPAIPSPRFCRLPKTGASAFRRKAKFLPVMHLSMNFGNITPTMHKKTDKKVIYLTFDCGYENGNTPAILNALKRHNVQATFFVVGNFLRDNPELIKQMLKGGHTIGNHTFHHPDMSQIATKETFSRELKSVEALYKDITGKSMTRFYRPPQGKYSTENLQMAKDMGYHTFFWSLAYVDWLADAQPSKEEAFDKLLGRIHPGAIVLLHNTSRTNGEILDELLAKWEEMGYTFSTLKKLVRNT